MSKPCLLFLDFETYYDDDYSLRKMPTPNYILDPRYETIMVAVKEGMNKSTVVDGASFPKYLSQFKPELTVTVTFNALFDNSILAWRYGFVPSMMLDAMGMARALRGHLLSSASLSAVSEHLGVGTKYNTLPKVKGMHAKDIKTAGLWQEFSDYAIQDNDLCAAIFDKLSPEFPASERRVMDLVIRCAVEPRFHVDTGMLKKHLVEVRDRKASLLRQAGGDIASLMSSDKFMKSLRDLGVKIKFKTSLKGKQIPAFAKTDEFMEELSRDADPAVQALVAARLGHKSTLEETRSQKLLDIAQLPWANYCRGNKACMPVPLRYGGAHTHRLSGEWGMNMQNLPRSGGPSKLRFSLIAPPGFKVVTADLGQIEARLTAWICGASLLLEQFAKKLDPYAMMASEIFGYPVDRKVQKVEGFIGKTAILGLGYGCGVNHFDDMVTTMARVAGIDLGDKWDIIIADKAVGTYRQIHRNIPNGWNKLDRILNTTWIGKSAGQSKFGPCLIEYGKVILPNGLSLNYDQPTTALDKNGQRALVYKHGRFTHKIYGAKLLENIIQALARIVVMNAALRLRDRGYRFVLQGHDELVFIIPDTQIDKAIPIIHGEMVRRPSWAPDLPLTAEVGVGQSYGDAK